MSDDHDAEPGPKGAPEESADARMRALILKRRNRFVAAAIAGLGLSVNGCSESHTGEPTAAGQGAGMGQAGTLPPGICLSQLAGTPAAGAWGGVGGVGGNPPAGTGGMEPNVCLSPPECVDGQPPPCVCLDLPWMPDAAVPDARPAACLTMDATVPSDDGGTTEDEDSGTA